MSCSGCGKKASDDVKLLICSACRSASYCSTDCQKKAWSAHKKQCTKNATLAMFKAIQTKDTETIKRLHKVKRVVPTDFGPNAYEMADWTPLHECIRKNEAGMLQLIIDGGVANLNIVDGDSSLRGSNK